MWGQSPCRRGLPSTGMLRKGKTEQVSRLTQEGGARRAPGRARCGQSGAQRSHEEAGSLWSTRNRRRDPQARASQTDSRGPAQHLSMSGGTPKCSKPGGGASLGPHLTNLGFNSSSPGYQLCDPQQVPELLLKHPSSIKTAV